MQSEDRLESWKEIAAYLKRDVRTVQRWEAFESLPVHRHQHKKRGSVFALRHELDTWRESRRAELFTPDAEHETPAGPAAESAAAGRPWWAWLAGAASIGVLVALVLMRDGGPAPITAGAGPIADAPRFFGEALRDGGRIDRIPLNGTASELALSPDDTTLYVSLCSPGATAVEAINLGTRSTKWRITPLKACSPLALSTNGDRLFLADGMDVLVVETNTGNVRRIPTPAASISDLVVTPDGKRVYVAAIFKGLLAITPSTGEVVTLNPLPCPMFLALTPAADRLYVSYQCAGPGGRRGHDAIEVIDTTTNRSVGVITGLPNVGGELLITKDGTHVFADGRDACVSQHYDHVGCPPGEGAIVHVIRTLDDVLVRTLRIGADFTVRMALSPDGSRLVAGSRHISVVSTANLREAEFLPSPLLSNAVFRSDGQVAYAAMGPATSVAVFSIPVRPAPPAGLTARWTMDGLGVDLVAENSFPTLTPDSFAPGRVGLAAQLSKEHPLRLSSPSNINIDNGFMTAMAWVNVGPEAPEDEAMTIFEHGAIDGRGLSGWRLMRLASGRAAACFGSVAADCSGPHASLIAGTSTIGVNAWHHIALTRDQRTVTLYVDGRVESKGSFDGGLPSLDTLWFRLGSDEGGTSPFLGRIDEAEIYSRPLTAAEISTRGK